MSVFLLVACLCSLSEEVESFMDDYGFAGYSSQWSRGLYLDVNESYTFLIYPGVNLEGVLCGVGGKAVFDLQMELHGGGLNIIDTEPDDFPVLRFVTGPGLVAYSVTVTAVDMLYGATADSVYVFFAMRPVTVKIENSVPGEPDLAITGE
ncbi:MAG: hypothetical protein U9P42_10250 [Candidatus Fermentibacteria bacterium]|nr:hypothetical protein [Candidatus Fermentibacteria bacterium]